MFFYFYDSFVVDKKHEVSLTRIENRIIELGINGRVEKLSSLRNMKELLEDGVKCGAHTIVIVGNDATLIKAINIIAPHNVVLGYIPFTEHSALAKLLGIPNAPEACNILSRRIVIPVHLAKANQNYFLGSLTIKNASTLSINGDNYYTISNTIPVKLTVANLGTLLPELDTTTLYLKGSRLHLQLQPAPPKRGLFSRQPKLLTSTILPAQRLTITHTGDGPVAAILDQETILKTPLTIVIKPKQLKLIVGKERLL